MEATLDPAAGCLKFCGVIPEDFGEIDPSEIIQVNPPPQAEVFTQPLAGSKRRLDLGLGIEGASTAQHWYGPEGETRFKREGSSVSTSSSNNEMMRGKVDYMSGTPPLANFAIEDSKKRALDEDAELEKKVAKFLPTITESQRAPDLPSSVTGTRNTQNATMQSLLPKIIPQSVADKLYPPNDDNTYYVVGHLNDRAPPVEARNPGPPGVPANAYASTALKLEVLTGFLNKILAITVSTNEENESNGGRMIGGNMFPPTFQDNLKSVKVYVANKTEMSNLQYSLMAASLAKTSLTVPIKVYTSDLEPRPHPTTGKEWEVEILFPLM